MEKHSSAAEKRLEITSEILREIPIKRAEKLAFAACQSVAKRPGTAYNPLFVYGGVGLGKTHLIQAIGNQMKKSNNKKEVEYVTSERFTTEFITAISEKKINSFKNGRPAFCVCAK